MERKMKKILFILFICMLLANPAAARIKTETYMQEARLAEEKIRQFLPRLRFLEDKYPNDIEIQLGLGVIYSKYATSPDFSAKAEEQYKKVLKIDPNNRPARCIIARRLCGQSIAERKSGLKTLETLIQMARKENKKEIRIHKDGRPLRWSEREGPNVTVITDFDNALEQFRRKFDEKLEKQLPVVLAEINKGKRIDPQNALYNYQSALLYFELGENEEAVKQIEEGAIKKYNYYGIEIYKARARVLREADFPQPHRRFIENYGIVHAWGNWLVQKIDNLAKDYKAQGSLKDAEKMYNLMIRVAEQVREEPVPYDELTTEKMSQGIENLANKGIADLYGKLPDPEQQMPVQSRISVGTYILIAASCGILIVGIILFLRKKGSTRSK
jgi:tetratricopeptide (TPR) repeat protein